MGISEIIIWLVQDIHVFKPLLIFEVVLSLWFLLSISGFPS